MGIFQRKKNDELFDDIGEGTLNIDYIQNLEELSVATDPSSDQSEGNARIWSSISDQIEKAKSEYDKIISELIPIKFELAEKKAELERVKTEYTITSQFRHARVT